MKNIRLSLLRALGRRMRVYGKPTLEKHYFVHDPVGDDVAAFATTDESLAKAKALELAATRPGSQVFPGTPGLILDSQEDAWTDPGTGKPHPWTASMNFASDGSVTIEVQMVEGGPVETFTGDQATWLISLWP